MAAAARAATAVAAATHAAGATGPARLALQRPAPQQPLLPPPLWQRRLPPLLRLEASATCRRSGLRKDTFTAQDTITLASWYHITQSLPATQKTGV